MAPKIEIRRLRPEDDRRNFSCGQPELDRFFQHYAGQNQFKLHLAVNYVAATADRTVGFATVAVGRTLPSARFKRRLPGYPLPVLRLARLGVDERTQGLGGSSIAPPHLGPSVDQRDSFECIGVVTDAKPEAVAFYTRYGFELLEGVREGALHGDPTPLFLPVAAAATAQAG